MKKIIGILSFFFFFGLILCSVFAFTQPVNVSIAQSSVVTYKICTAVESFLIYLPSLMMTGYIVSFSIYFGQNSEGSMDRFSTAMGKRLKIVFISAILCSCVLTLGTELCGYLASNKKKEIVNRPKIISEYLSVGNVLYDEGFFDRSAKYAAAVLTLDPDSREGQLLKQKAEYEKNKRNTTTFRNNLFDADSENFEKIEEIDINKEKLSDVYQLLLKSRSCYEKSEWFNAHYYAHQGIELCTSKDPNLDELKELSEKAWNNITEIHKLSKTEDQKIFDRKYEGYLALTQNDSLKAYYIFQELAQTSFELQNDPDVEFYLNVAKEQVTNKYFFIDETYELSRFESASDVYFAYTYQDGSKDIFYIKGVTTTKETGNSIQYLRNLTIESIDENGNFIRKMNVPYAKMLPVSVETLNNFTRHTMEIGEKVKFIPYLMLYSISRDNEGSDIKPTYIDADGKISNSPEYLLLPVSYDDFILLESASTNPQSLSLENLIKLIGKADKYGFSSTTYGQALMYKIMYPLYMIILFVFLATIGWNFRTGINQYFKLTWAFAFPLFNFVCLVAYQIIIYMYSLTNYVFVGLFGPLTGLLAGAIFYIIVLFIDGIYFLARHSK